MYAGEKNKHLARIIVLILDGYLEHVEHTSRKICLFGEKIRLVTALSMPLTDQNTEIALYVRIYF